jgi:Flagellar hook-length control protein FliK
MKVTSHPEATGARSAAADTPQSKPRTRFSDLLEKEKQSAGMPSPTLAPPGPFYDIGSVETGHGVPQSDALLTSLVQEITLQAPPGSSAAVDIQFDSRTLNGLSVRVQKAGDSVEIRFSTSSEAVSRLLTTNAQSLSDALVQRGYVAPTVSIQQTSAPATFSASEFRQGGRDSGNRGRQDQGRGQKRR